MSVSWLIDERQPLAKQDLSKLERILSSTLEDEGRGAIPTTPTLAVRLRDMVVHDNKALFGAANIRLDTLVIHGNGNGQDSSTFYMPRTQLFPQVKDGTRLLVQDSNLLIFYGQPKYFMDIFVLLSRDTRQADQLVDLLTKNMQSPGLQEAFTTLIGLTAVAPYAAAISAATEATAVIGDVAYKLLRQATGTTIGFYRQSFLQFRDDFGLNPDPGKPGRHPAEDSYRDRGFSFWYEIVDETPPSSNKD
jgi:hypothetical protein